MSLTEIGRDVIAVRDPDGAGAFDRTALGAEVDHGEIVLCDGADEALVEVADSDVELTATTRCDSPIAKSIEQRGESLHHGQHRVDERAAALVPMVAVGATRIDREPRQGSCNITVAIHPKGSFGTLIELVQE